MLNTRTVLAAAATASALFVSGAVKADDDDHHFQRRFTTNLSGFHEVAGNSTTGEGRLTLTINDKDQTIDFKLTFKNLSGNPAAAHVHFGQNHTNGGVMFFFCGGGPQNTACPAATEGTLTGTISATDIVGPAAQGIAIGEFAEAIAAIRGGVAYGNIHTAMFPGGEIRGQLR